MTTETQICFRCNYFRLSGMLSLCGVNDQPYYDIAPGQAKTIKGTLTTHGQRSYIITECSDFVHIPKIPKRTFSELGLL